MENVFDIAVIGSGPGGYPAAIRAAQLGKKVALIEAFEIGGTCLNRGCIPSKTLLSNAEVLRKIKHSNDFGITVDNVNFDYDKMITRKDDLVSKMRSNLTGLISGNGVTIFKGYGKLISTNEIKISGENNGIIKADRIILATGSEPKMIPTFPCDHERILDSTDILNRRTLPKKIAIIGGGIIGCEFASLYKTFGVEVTILEMMPSILPMESNEISTALTKAFDKQGIKIETNVTVLGIDKTQDGITVKLSGGKEIEADIALVAVGRQMNTSDIGLEKVGILASNNGLIPVNEKMETVVKGIYAIGDIASKWWLAHVATHQGLVAANNACGQEAHMHYNAIPSAIFTVPEIGTVGLSLSQAKDLGYNATLGAFPFLALGKSQATLETDGFGQIVIDKNTGHILGAQVIGYQASTLIAEMGIAIANELTVESISETIHAHPTIAEIWLEAAYVAEAMPLHIPKKKRLN
jgi:dihydrolipoamide dehydrogenase